MDDLCETSYSYGMRTVVRSDEKTILSIDESKLIVENVLKDYFAERIAKAETVDGSYAQLWRSIEKLFLAGGKRIRPYVTMLSFQAYSDASEMSAIAPAAAAQELLHLAMLIHDDIIDRDRVRYGIANVSGQYDETYSTLITDTSEREHFSDSAATLAGDLLLSDAYGLITRCDIEPKLILEAQSILNDAVYAVVGGELLDTESAFRPSGTSRPLDIALLKTASYTFVSPLLMGAGFTGVSDEQKMHLRTFGEAIGVAYQLQDDLLGMFGNSERTGKSVTSDLAEGKYTHLVQLFYELADASQRKTYDEIAGRGDVSDVSAGIAKSMLVESGAKAALEDRIESLRSSAHMALMALTIHDDYKEQFRMLVEQLMGRDK